MIRSMTAFGRCVKEQDGRRYTVEIRSVNNRYLDCTVKLPRLWGYLEEPIKAEISRAGISRGKVEVFVSIETLSEEDAVVVLDSGYARGYLQALHQLKDEFALPGEITVMSVASNRELFRVTRPQTDEDEEWNRLSPILSEALAAFTAMREREGERLIRDLREKATRLAEIRERILAKSEENIASYRTRLESRLRAVLEENGVKADEARILTECAIFADKVSVDEEMVRLSSHFVALEEAFSSSEAVGRRLDFLVQEINREVNTTGSKIQDLQVTRVVVDMKSEIEKIREQIQNIE